MSILALVASIITVSVFLPCLRPKYWISDTHFRSRLSSIVWTLSAFVMVAALVAALTGFSSLAGDLLSALFRSALLIGGALLLREVIGESIRAFMTPGRRFYDTLSRTTGLSPETGRRLTFWVRFAADVILWPPVIYGVLLACKISPTLLNAWGALLHPDPARRYQPVAGRRGDRLLTVVLGLLVVGGMKRWVRERVMPNTQLDLGMQNSISTGVGISAASS